MKIAVCLSGQPRSVKYTIPSISKYFTSSDYTVDFFCHSWDYNTWKYKGNTIVHTSDEKITIDELYSDLLKLSPKQVLIESKEKLPSEGPWHSLFYSMMMANNLKKQYEISKNFRYDIVVKTRYDLIYSPLRVFVPETLKDKHDILTTHADRMKLEYNKINVSDVFFYGSSGAMDIVTDAYRYVKQLYKKLDDYENLGPGVLIGEYCSKYNIQVSKLSDSFPEVFYRKESIPLDPVVDYERIHENSRRYYI
jgi:hypothetical protein